MHTNPSYFDQHQLTKHSKIALLASLYTCLLACKTDLLPSSSPQPSIALSCATPTQPFTLKHLPAVSKDRTLVALAISSEDSPRGAHNLTLQLRNPNTDTLVSETLILAAYQNWTCDDDQAPIKKRIQDALDTLEEHSWDTMEEFDLPTPPTSAPHRATVATHTASDLILTYSEPNLWAVSTRNTRSTQASMYTWSAQSLPSLHDNPMPCTQPGHMSRAWTSSDAQVIAVQLYYSGNDSCTEPDSRFFTHALSTPPENTPSCIRARGTCTSVCPEDTRALPKLECPNTDVCCLASFQADLLFPTSPSSPPLPSP